MYTFLTILFVLISLIMIVVILLQAGKGQGLAGSIGGGMGAQSVFGGRGAGDFLTKATAYLAVGYALIAIALGIIYKTDAQDAQKSLIQQRLEQQQAAPASSLPVVPVDQFPKQDATPQQDGTQQQKPAK